MDLRDAEKLQDDLISSIYGKSDVKAFSYRGHEKYSIQMFLQDLRYMFASLLHKPAVGIGLGENGFGVAIRALDRICDRRFVDNLLVNRGISDTNIDVQYIEPIKAFGGSSLGSIECVFPGLSISHSGSSLGTLGCFVRKKVSYDSDRLMFLSNNHVIVKNNNFIDGAKVYQIDETKSKDILLNEIGSLFECIKLRYRNNLVDAAVALLKEDFYPDKVNYIDEIGYIEGKYEERILPGLKVKKYGTRTGFTQGEVQAVLRSPLEVKFKTTIFGILDWDMPRHFLDVIEIVSDSGKPFSLPGDSGSLLLDQYNRAVALLFAGNKSKTYAISIREVFDQLDIDLA